MHNKIYLKREPIDKTNSKPCIGCYFAYKGCTGPSMDYLVCIDGDDDYIFVEVKKK